MKISNKWYNIIKYVSATVIPALVVFLSVIGEALDLSWMNVVVMIIGAFGVFLGELIKGSSKAFWKTREIIEINNEEVEANDESRTG